LSGNVMDSNRYNFCVEGSPQSVDTSNLVDGKPVYYFVNQSDIVVNPVAYPEVGYLGFVNCVNVTVQGMNLTNNGQGLLLAYTNDSKITGNSLANNKLGIDLESSSSNTLSGNNVTNDYDGQIAILLTDSCNNNNIYGNALIDLTGNGDGINVENSCNDNVISGNVVTGNVTGFGVGIILMESCNNNTISDNSVARNGQGIFLEDSSNSNSISGNNVTANELEGVCLELCDSNDISGNNVTGSPDYGISLGSSSNNTLSGNNVANNYWGIDLDSSCNNNTIYHNNFVNNTSQVPPFFSGGTNTWDNGYPSGGNYWSDYNGTDLCSGPYQNVTGSDGIGDTPYVIDANNTDYYPLMGMFSDFNVAVGVDVQVVSNSTVSDFEFNGTAILFNVSGENGTMGFCSVCIPTAMLNGTLKVFVNGTQVQFSLLPSLNSTSSYVYFTYSHSTEQVIILPEFPSFLILQLMMIATLLGVIIYKKKAVKTSKS
jgi:parallel beta-helix repeat protein